MMQQSASLSRKTSNFKRIVIDEVYGYNPLRVSVIEIFDREISSGGQSKIYLDREGKNVVKLLFNPSDYNYVKKTIEKFRENNEALNHPSLKAFPLFCFSGLMDNVRVYGTVMKYFSQRHYKFLDQVNFNQFERINVCRQIAEVMDIFRRVGFVYIDISPDNILIDLKTKEVIFIDFESGGIIDSLNAKTCTDGKCEGLEAPEMFLLSLRQNFTYSVYIDWWSIAVLFFKLLTDGLHPFIMFKRFSDDVVEYIKNVGWPNYSSKYWRTDLPNLREVFEKRLSLISDSAMEKFKITFNKGFLKPSERVPPSEWVKVFNDMIEPNIRYEIIKNKKEITFRWKALNVKGVTIKIGPCIKNLSTSGGIKLKLSSDNLINDIEIVLKGRCGYTKRIKPEILLSSP